MRSLAMLLAAVLVGMSVFALIFIGYDLRSGRMFHPITIWYLLILVFSLTFGYIAFRPNALEDSVRIIGFDYDSQYIWLQLKNTEYRMQFIRTNEPVSELVTWIEMA